MRFNIFGCTWSLVLECRKFADKFVNKNYEDLLGVSNSLISLESFIDYDWDGDVFGR